MLPDPAQLAQAGAAALVTATGTQLWDTARTPQVRLFASIMAPWMRWYGPNRDLGLRWSPPMPKSPAP
ncbi:hypothetical protein [Nocardiopsis chromatogenes]|uniref:hypothetical protein n=1 Tax=Nocardiopsis chromatogenes TaxID=280239 RepID=UPI00034C5AFA|nr:hypothetical protein [Nocardiopsis chromatogenes]